MIVRLWRARLDPARLAAYRRFEHERCLPMLHKQPGFLCVLFARATQDRTLSITVWEDGGAVEALESSPSYRETTREMAELGLLSGGWTVEILEVTDAVFRVEALLGTLDRRRSSGAP